MTSGGGFFGFGCAYAQNDKWGGFFDYAQNDKWGGGFFDYAQNDKR